ncbi:MAG: bifunctional UDP-sugar hydrolase/5'-nucleotidase [Eubacterium aggregans]|uniref:bifunctional metallophosphatase/5'-nucleotidase n=1 Tax=Eubacterium aggregans TaxID=81409 RepID=UPI0023F4B306|nr:bifunctional UDP-sugar hydrolase/5'-nucleotidase [Eubacterium aggregans]MDD4691102.1 bifunctional UDP-sugar hydrolase/5'-nucleotidase [Eubacterium aggregans]MEA5073853.1 bifunctional UDP-sugar hydrolase/5'-nucleotidase [Eubacterium aggregans]
MKRRWPIFFLTILLLLLSVPTAAYAEDSNKDIRILFTHDLHSNILPYETVDSQSNVTTMGGYARLATLIKQNRNGSTLLVDAGDYSMGTLFNSLYRTQAPDLALLGQLGYDATTLGNHEFDYGTEALKSDLLAAAKTNPHPTLLASNLVFGEDDDSKSIQQAFETYGSLKTKIITKNGVKIGVFGLMGKDAQSFTADYAPLSFADVTDTAKSCVEDLKSQGAQVIICLSHSGTEEDIKNSEDQQLAKAVPDIDVIVSGHTHTTMESPITEGSTTIVSAGWRGQNLGVLDLTLKADGSTAVKDYALKASANSIPQDESIKKFAETYKASVQTNFLTPLGMQYDGVLAISNINFNSSEDALQNFGNNNIGDLVTDSQLYYAKQNGIDATIAVTCAGLIRDTIYKGDLTTSQVFNIQSLGESTDGSTGYPLVDFYLYGSEIKTLCQLDPAFSKMIPDIQLSLSGLRYTYNDSRLPMDKVISVDVQDSQGNWSPIVDDQLYHMTCSKYLADMTGLITDMTKGLVTLTPRDANGNTNTDTTAFISKTKEGKEAKAWIALASYAGSFAKNESGISVIPAQYNNARDTKTAVSNSMTTFFKNPSIYALALYGIILGIVLIVIIIILVIRHHKKGGRRNKKRLSDKL